MSPPDIIVITTDQQRADFSRAMGFALDTTPFVDALGTRGVRFRQAYTPMPTRPGSRTSLLCGRFPTAHRVRQSGNEPHYFRLDDLPTLLRRHGYSLNLIGLNGTFLRPNDLDLFVPYSGTSGGRPGRITPQQRAMDAWAHELMAERGSIGLTPTPFPLECLVAYRAVSDAIECVDSRLEAMDDRPFFLWLSFPQPHHPYHVPEPYFSLFPEADLPERAAGPEVLEARGGKWCWQGQLTENAHPGYDALWRRYRANYCGMLRLLDDQIKRFVTHLEARDLFDKTLLVVTSDCGEYAGEYGLQRKGVGLPECLVRVPLVFAGRGVAPRAAGCDEIVSLVDVFPTLCEALGVKRPRGVQGRSLWPLLTGGDIPAEEFRSIFVEFGVGGLDYATDDLPPGDTSVSPTRYRELNAMTLSGRLKMVRLGEWKLIIDTRGCGQLHHLVTDPAELRNRFDDPACRDVRRELTEELVRWMIRAEDDLPLGASEPKWPPRGWYAAIDP